MSKEKVTVMQSKPTDNRECVLPQIARGAFQNKQNKRLSCSLLLAKSYSMIYYFFLSLIYVYVCCRIIRTHSCLFVAVETHKTVRLSGP